MDELRITEWSIGESGHLMIRVVGELGMSDRFHRVLIADANRTEYYPSVAATRRTKRPIAARWGWRKHDIGGHHPVRVPAESQTILDRLVLDHDPLGRIADSFGIGSAPDL